MECYRKKFKMQKYRELGATLYKGPTNRFQFFLIPLCKKYNAIGLRVKCCNYKILRGN